MFEIFLARYPYVMTSLLLVIGLYGVLVKHNFVKKLIGLNIFQTGIFLFFIQGSVKHGGTIPYIDSEVGTAAVDYVNPLPHVLILTAIVVGLAMTGVALSLLLNIQRHFGSVDEEVLLERMKPLA